MWTTHFQMRATFLVLFIFFVTALFGQEFSEFDSLSATLVKEMSRKERYDQDKIVRIAAYHKLSLDPNITESQRFEHYLTIAKEFEKYSFDSTLFYLEKSLKVAYDLKEQVLINKAKLYLSSNLGNVGRSKEAEDVLRQIRTENLSPDLFIKYCNTARRLYEDLSYYAMTLDTYKSYSSLYSFYKDTLVSILPDDSDLYLDLIEKDLLDARNLDECLEVNTKRLANFKMGTQKYSLITFQRALIFEILGENELQKKFLILSATSDIKASVKDNASLTKLASLLFKEGEIETSYNYIQSAYEDAVNYNSRLRFLEISKTLSLITAAYQQISDEQKDSLRWYLIIISILTVVLLITIFFITRQVNNLSLARNELKESNTQLSELNENLVSAKGKLEEMYLNLSESNHIKEHYIANFLSIHSEYIDKIDKYQKVVKKMLASRKYEELYQRANSQEVVQAEISEFYKTFDQAFLHIYPDFISQLNSLLLEDEKIILKDDELLNTELRIFALIRLGIKDSSQISRLLRYSVNTIYNYRVRIKNKSAVPREEFEEYVQNINAFQKEQ